MMMVLRLALLLLCLVGAHAFTPVIPATGPFFIGPTDKGAAWRLASARNSAQVKTVKLVLLMMHACY